MTQTISRKLKVDLKRCQGHARCMEIAPQVFDLAADTGLAFVRPEADLKASAAAVDKAILACPECALSWGNDGAAD
jgi:ferredoxin